MKKVRLEEWTPTDNIVLEDNADFAVKCKGNILVVAGPGAGKTELLAQKAGYLFQTDVCKNPQKILAISFKADAAENLKQRVCKRYGNEIKSRFSSMTYDAFSKRLLDRFRLALPIDWQPDKDYQVNNTEIIDAAFKKAGYNNPHNLKKGELRKFYEQTLSSVRFPIKQENLGEKVWKLLIKGFDGNRATLDFKMMCILSEYIVRSNPQIKRALQCTYTHVFLDEFQDTTNLQYRLVKTCFKDSRSVITAVGDNKQRIMLWAGALKSVFTDFKVDFLSQQTQLIMNHRSAPRLVMLQKQMYDSLNEKTFEVKPSDKWQPDDGKIKLLITHSEQDEAKIICEDIMSRISEGVRINDICILCKQLPQNYAETIITELGEAGIRARIENEYQDLLKEPIIDLAIRFMILALDRKRPNEWEYIKNIFEEFSGADNIQQDKIYYECQEKLSKKLNDVQALMGHDKDEIEIKSVINEIINLFDISMIKAYFPVYQQGDYFDELIEKFEIYLEDELQRASYNWILALESFGGKNSIPIMTIHKSKGLEYSAVYFVGLEDGAFWSFKSQSDEDRCAFFVAISRAKKYLMFTYCSYRANLKFPRQSHREINEYFELLQIPGVAEIQEMGNDYGRNT